VDSSGYSVAIKKSADTISLCPISKGLKGVSAKEKRKYEHVKRSAQSSGRYGKRAKEVTARTVMKQHRKHPNGS
jgi:hypothetical protein